MTTVDVEEFLVVQKCLIGNNVYLFLCIEIVIAQSCRIMLLFFKKTDVQTSIPPEKPNQLLPFWPQQYKASNFCWTILIETFRTFFSCIASLIVRKFYELTLLFLLIHLDFWTHFPNNYRLNFFHHHDGLNRNSFFWAKVPRKNYSVLLGGFIIVYFESYLICSRHGHHFDQKI